VLPDLHRLALEGLSFALLRNLKDYWNQRVERPKNYGQNRSRSAVGAQRILERVNEHFQSDLETLQERGTRGNPKIDARLRCAGWVESGRNCDLILRTQQPFSGPED
jgi:hypothetical protein